MCKIQTSKLTGTVHHGNTWSQVSTGPLPIEKNPSRQSRTHISLKHNESQTQKRKTQEADVFFCFFFGYTMRVWTPVSAKINHLLLIPPSSSSWYPRRAITWPVRLQSLWGHGRSLTPRTPGWWRSCGWGCSTGTWVWAHRSGRRAPPAQCARGNTGHPEVRRHWCLTRPPSRLWTLAWLSSGANYSWWGCQMQMDSPVAAGSERAATLSKVWHWPRGLYCPAVPFQTCWGFFCRCSWWCHKSLSQPWHPFPQGWKGWCDYRRCLLGFLPVTLASSICQNVPVRDIRRCSGLICLALQQKQLNICYWTLLGEEQIISKKTYDILNDEHSTRKQAYC